MALSVTNRYGRDEPLLAVDGNLPVSDATSHQHLAGIVDRLERAVSELGRVYGAVANLDGGERLAGRIEAAIAGMIAELPAPTVNVPASSGLPNEQVDRIIGGIAEAIAELRPEMPIEALTKALSRSMPTVISGVTESARLKNANQDIINPATEETVVTLATQATLADALARLANIDDALTNTDSATQAAGAAVPANTWTDIVTITRTTAITVTGFNADVDSLLDVRYRYRLQVDGVTKVSEVVTSGRMSWIPVTVDAPANATVKVQVFHSDVSPTDFQAAIAYQE